MRIDNRNGTISVLIKAVITLKNIPPELHRRLKKRAQERHRSLNKEIISTLNSATRSGAPSGCRRLDR
ncbi:MAG: hypothetical protein DME76_07555 [Verrucomicrobia bacterium]|nr:MAG: hypothetical protein DME76_07555 [Verrucomicrobiota bacterium]